MYRKINIKHLTLVFVVLLVIVVVTEWTGSRRGSRTFKEDLVEVDPGSISSVEVFPKVAGGEKIRLFRENDMWMVASGEEKFPADPSVAGSLVEELNRATPESVVAVHKDRWENFEVTDSLGTRVKLFRENDLLADLIIGKFSFSQSRKMTSYVRLAGEKEVYGVDGMLGMSFNRNLNAFRNRTVIKSSSSDWSRLTFNYPADSSYVLQKAGDKWMIDGQPADSAAVADYFSEIRSLNDSRFAEAKPSVKATHQLKIEGNNEMEPIEINGFYIDGENFVVESSLNRGNFFNSADLAKKIFISRSGLQ